LEVAAGRQELLAVLREAHGLPLDPGEHTFGENDLIAVDRRQLVKLDVNAGVIPQKPFPPITPRISEERPGSPR
jgi:hypothetical protein